MDEKSSFVTGAIQVATCRELRDLESVQHCLELPDSPQRVQGLFANIRHNYLNVYRRLFAIILAANMIGHIILALEKPSLDTNVRVISSAASVNLTVAILARQEYMINFLFEILVRCKWAPLRVRGMLCKIYELGGVHSGCAFNSTVWFIRLTYILARGFETRELQHVPSLVVLICLVVLFVAINVMAYPKLRIKAHDLFERTHRYAGWACNALFWTLIVLSAQALADRLSDSRSTGQTLVTLPSFYLLTFNTLHAFLPWILLRRLPATGIRLSNHALRLHLKSDSGKFYTIRLSDNPLVEWHSFAIFPDLPDQSVNGSTNSCIISRAGDWTSKTIENPATTYWTRGFPTRGALYMSLIFKRVVIVTTGSGIGPCLNLLTLPASERPECRVIWSASRPADTFGKDVCDAVLHCDSNAMIWDTKERGRPDLVLLAWRMAKEIDAEAVFCVSNNKVTKMVVWELNRRGLPAFGPIFDS
jgi:NADH:ubiquinone oxidoreductase subunit 6 (subunit J)